MDDMFLLDSLCAYMYTCMYTVMNVSTYRCTCAKVAPKIEHVQETTVANYRYTSCIVHMHAGIS